MGFGQASGALAGWNHLLILAVHGEMQAVAVGPHGQEPCGLIWLQVI